MSAGAPRREVAHRLFAVEFDDATVSRTESDEDMAPSYVVTPTGAMVNRAFIVGTLTSVDQVGDDIYRGRVADPTDTFVTYAGQYQPAPANFLAEADPPAVVAITGKARTFQPDGSDDVLSSIRPERIVETTPATRDRWVLETAVHTLGRVELLATVRAADVPNESVADVLQEANVPPHVALGMQRAIEAYDTSSGYLAAVKERAIEALEVVAGKRDSVEPLDIVPDADDPDSSYATLTDGGFIESWLGHGVDLDTVETPSLTPPDDELEADVTADTEADEPEVAEEEPPAEEPETPPEAAVAGEGEGATGMYEMSDEEREEVESEFGVDFETGDEIDPDTPESPPDPESPPPEPPTTEEEEPELEQGSDEEDEEIDIKRLVIEHMRELDDGDGAERRALVDAVLEASGASEDEVDDAIQDALMSGTCYEPTEDRLKPI